MEASISAAEIRQLLVANGGKMTNKALVKHFKKLLDGKSNAENRSKFKNIINEIAIVGKDTKGRDIIMLKAEDSSEKETSDRENQKPFDSSTEQEGGEGGAIAASKLEEQSSPMSVDLSMENESGSPIQNVREIADRLNREEEVRERESPAKLLRQATGDEACVCASSNAEEDNTISLDDVKRQWMIIAAKSDYQAMARFLKDHHHLVGWKNFCNGYTALHYASKVGDLDCIKLIAGSHKANVNVINHAGMTPLHLAAMHNRGDAIQLLVQTYKADANIRDYRGKLPKDYLTDNATRRMSLHVLDAVGTVGTFSSNNGNVTSLEAGFYLEPEELLTADVRHYLEGLNRTATIHGDTLMVGEGYAGTLKPGDTLSTSHLMRRSFRVGTGRPAALHVDPLTLSETYASRKGSYLAAPARKSNTAVARAMSMPKSRTAQKRQLKSQKRITSLVEDVQEDSGQ